MKTATTTSSHSANHNETSKASSAALWRAAQAVALASTVALLAGLVWRPDQSLHLLWKIIIPLVPASLLVSPMLWRNVCPLATLNMIPNRRQAPIPSDKWAAGAAGVGVVLLGVLVPARHLVFNTNGLILAVTVSLVAIAAMIMGRVFDAKAGFCNGFCPVLPVERLYGQNPLVELSNPRCPACTHCSKGCIDLAPRKSISQVFGRKRHSMAWMKTPFGLFAAGFPGFVVGYFNTADSPLGETAQIYLQVAAWVAASLVLTWAIVVLFEVGTRRLLPTLAAAAVGLYYWYAAPDLAAAVAAPPAVGIGLQIAALALVGLWWVRALRTAPNGQARTTP